MAECTCHEKRGGGFRYLYTCAGCRAELVGVEALDLSVCKRRGQSKSRAWSTGVRKRSKKSCAAALAVSERCKAESDRIRRAHGLDEVDESSIVKGWREKVGS